MLRRRGSARRGRARVSRLPSRVARGGGPAAGDEDAVVGERGDAVRADAAVGLAGLEHAVAVGVVRVGGEAVDDAGLAPARVDPRHGAGGAHARGTLAAEEARAGAAAAGLGHVEVAGGREVEVAWTAQAPVADLLDGHRLAVDDRAAQCGDGCENRQLGPDCACSSSCGCPARPSQTTAPESRGAARAVGARRRGRHRKGGCGGGRVWPTRVSRLASSRRRCARGGGGRSCRPSATSRMMPPAKPAPIAAEAQSKPSLTLCTTGAAGSMTTLLGGLRVDRRGGRARRHGGEGEDHEADEDQAGDAVRDLHDGLLPRRSWVDADDALWGRYTRGRLTVYSRARFGK